MLQKGLSGLASLSLLFLFSAPMIVKAGQLFGVSQDNPNWSDWKSAPNFPGIKIRVLCGTYVDGSAQWSFQFKNTYSKKVYLVEQEEARDSTGAPPRFGAPGGINLGPGQKSDVYTAYLKGTCEARKQIFIRIERVEDYQGNETQPLAGASRSGSFNAPAHSSSTSGTRSAGSQTGGSGVSKTATQSSSASAGNNSTGGVSSASAKPGPPVRTASSDIAGTKWVCDVKFFDTGGGFGSTEEPFQSQEKTDFVFDFHPGGSYDTFEVRDDGTLGGAMERPDHKGRWTQSGSLVQWTAFNQEWRTVDGTMSDGTHMVAHMNRPPKDEYGTIWHIERYTCTLKQP